MSWYNKVVWSEGMFLQPQHFQQQERYLEHLIEARTAPLRGYQWGHVSVQIDQSLLKLGKLGLSAGQGLMPDGTPFAFPGPQLTPEVLDIPGDTRNELVLLTAPLSRPGRDEVQEAQANDNPARYRVSEFDARDTHTGIESSAAIQVGELGLRLMLARDKSDAFACLGVVRVVERRPNGEIILDKSYIPATLSVRDNPELLAYVREIQGLLHQRGDALANELLHPNHGGVAEINDFLFLQTVNRFEPLYAHLAQTQLLHPERLYAQSLMLAGELSIFSSEAKRPREYPLYDHDDPASCFAALVDDIRESLTTTRAARAQSIPLQDRGHDVYIAVVRDQELLRGAKFVLAVNAEIPGETLRSRFPKEITLAPAEALKELANNHLPGIGLTPLPTAPRQIPYHAGFNYFELDRDNRYWRDLEKSRGLALHIAGNFPGIEMSLWAIRT